MIREPKNRSQQDPRTLWDLTALYQTEAAFEQDFEKAKCQLEQVKAWQGRVQEDPRAAIRESTAMDETLEKLYTYAGLHRDEDTGDEQRQAKN